MRRKVLGGIAVSVTLCLALLVATLSGALRVGAANGIFVAAAGTRSQTRQQEVAPTIPETPSVATTLGTKVGNVRTYSLTASQFTQKIANFPLKTAQV